MLIEEKLAQKGIVLPIPPKPAGSYIPIVTSGNLVFVSGQIPMKDGKVKYTGKVTNDNTDTALESAKLCAINILAQVKNEIGTLDKISRIVKMSGFVNCNSDFVQHPKIINAASDFMFEIFGEKAKHARIAVGVSSLPLDAMTEIDAIIEIESDN